MKNPMVMGLLLAASAAFAGDAEMIGVPCAEYVEVMKVRTNCAVIPVQQVNANSWRKRLYERCLIEHKLRPWDSVAKREVCAESASEEQPMPTAALSPESCTLPPWKRPNGLVCK
jgi:hypothetical protein